MDTADYEKLLGLVQTGESLPGLLAHKLATSAAVSPIDADYERHGMHALVTASPSLTCASARSSPSGSWQRNDADAAGSDD